MGCEMEVSLDENNNVKVSGGTCKLGQQYAQDELLNPSRIVTSTVKVKNGFHALVPVWTTQPVPKDKVLDIMKELRNVEIQAPVQVHQIIIKNILGLGVDIETSGSIPAL